jgi:hypothetical protein
MESNYNKSSMPKVYSDKKRHLSSLHEQKQEICDAITTKRQQVAVTQDPEKKGLLLTEIESDKRKRACLYSQIFYFKSGDTPRKDLKKMLDQNNLQQEKCQILLSATTLPESEKPRLSNRLQKLKEKHTNLQERLKLSVGTQTVE